MKLLKNIWKIEDEKHFKWVKIIRFIVSGGIATVINVSALYFFAHFLHIWYLWSAVLGYIFGTVISFILQKLWTFRNASRENMHTQFIFFVGTGILGVFVNTGLVYLLVEHGRFHYLVAQILSGLVIALINYFIYKELVFNSAQTEKIFSFINKHKTKFILGFLFIIFLSLRLPGLSLPYHQDEWKTVGGLAKGAEGVSGLHHPPLTQLAFRLDWALFPENLRLLPLIFSILAGALLFTIVKKRVGREAAFSAILLFTICFYSVFASLMLDTDGSILVFFFLLSVYSYDRWRETGKKIWFGILFSTLILGFLVKLSFILAIGALVLDFLFDKYKNLTKREIGIGVLYIAGFFILSAVFIFFTHLIYPAFKIGAMFSHAASYMHLGGRNFLQTIVQGIKAIFYLSPVLILPLFFLKKEMFLKLRVFFIYLCLGFLFYFIIFDFSGGALDKYLMFAILPLSAISGLIIADIFKNGFSWRDRLFPIVFGSIIGLLLFALNFLPHSIISLYPKTEWFSRVIHLKWQMLNPFTGGNGPTGFYVSFLFIGASFILSLALATLGFIKKEWRNASFIIILSIGIVYNAVFIEELLFGKINGSAGKVIAETVDFIDKSSKINEVLTYNDAGAYDLSKTGKYAGRFYAVPAYEENHKKLFENFGGHYLIVDVPHLYDTGFYGEFFKKCKKIFETRSGYIDGYVLECPKRPSMVK